MNLCDAMVELYRKASTSLPEDVVFALRKACDQEKQGSNAKSALSAILSNIDIAGKTIKPLCQDTGVPVFFIKAPETVNHIALKKEIIRATRIATRSIPLRPNAVDSITNRNSGDNTGVGFPVIYIEASARKQLIIDLMLKGSGSENIGQLYRLPAAELKAERDLAGVKKCVLDTVFRAQGKGCPPYIIGIGVGATKDQVTRLSKVQLLRHLEDQNENAVLQRFEQKILDDINYLGIGPIGFGGKTTAMAVKIGVNHRHPASYFVDISVSCWANRRARLIWNTQNTKCTIQN